MYQADSGAKDSRELEGEDVPSDRQEEHGRCGGVRRGTAVFIRRDSGSAVKTEAGGHRWGVNNICCPLRYGFARASACRLQGLVRDASVSDSSAPEGAFFLISVAAVQSVSTTHAIQRHKKSEQCTKLYASTSPYVSLRTYLLCTPAARAASCARYVSQLLHYLPRNLLKGVTGNNFTRQTFTINKLNGCQLFTRQTAEQVSTNGCEWRQLHTVYSVAGRSPLRAQRDRPTVCISAHMSGGVLRL